MPELVASPLCTQVSSATSRWDPVYLLADDLTGACDAAAAFLGTDRSVRVWFGASALFPAPETVQAFNTDSRSLSPSRAATAVTRAFSPLRASTKSLIFKKIDSAARGPLAAEILAAHRALQTRAVLLAPAFPAMGRRVRNGILDIEDAAGQRSRINLTSLFLPKNRPAIALISQPSELAPALESGKAVLMCDAATQADLETLVRTAESLPGLLYAGSAGLARALASLHATPAPTERPLSASRALIVAGSPHPVTRLQLKVFDRDRFPDARVLRIRDRRDHERILAEFKTFAPQALILTGGDTALIAVHVLGAHSLIVRGEIAPGIPWGIVQGGRAQGCVVVTKSGGFGAPTAFNDILAAFRGSV